MSFDLKFIAIILSLISIMFAVAYIAAPGRSRLAAPSSEAQLMRDFGAGWS
jgi:hypothetical protein